jgi:hypothetical protein
MTRPAGKHILFALQSLAHLPYHVSTLAALDELDARVTVVFCRGRKAKKNVPAATPADDAAFLAWVDAIPARHPNLTFFEEGEGHAIRSRVSVDPSRSWPRTLRSYSHYLRRLGPRNKYTERWRNYLPRRLRLLTSLSPVRSVLRTDFAFRRLTAMEDRLPADPAIHEWLRANDVDAVVASPTNRRNSSEAEFVKSARRCGIPTAVSVLSWDTLSTKGLIPCPPTMLLAWNDAHASDAIDLHGLDPDSVVVAGSPFFDKWFREEDLDPRPEFLARLGLPPDARYLLYLGSSTMIAFNESWLVRQVRETLDRTPALAGLELVVRPHPANDRLVHDLQDLPCVHIDVSGLPFSDETQRHLAGVIRYADAFVGVNTSGMLDAIILDKPGFSILTDDYRETQADAPHFRDLLDAQALYLEPDLESFAERLASVLAGDDPKAAERAHFVRRFVRPRGPEPAAGRIQAEAILLLAGGTTPQEIETILSEPTVQRAD